ncbi:hypothetical protein CTI14_00620 [Methylobacterium radiotolerans]|nr:hypothetical protein CTI14_00620 [Methylobacterium radiotolerans]
MLDKRAASVPSRDPRRHQQAVRTLCSRITRAHLPRDRLQLVGEGCPGDIDPGAGQDLTTTIGVPLRDPVSRTTVAACVGGEIALLGQGGQDPGRRFLGVALRSEEIVRFPSTGRHVASEMRVGDTAPADRSDATSAT